MTHSAVKVSEERERLGPVSAVQSEKLISGAPPAATRDILSRADQIRKSSSS